ncbi:hypothetical protein STEG23_028897 [Scotinomys teguina]
MARKAGQGKEEEESRARQQEEKTPVREEEKTPACDGRGHHVVEQGSDKSLITIQDVINIDSPVWFWESILTFWQLLQTTKPSVALALYDTLPLSCLPEPSARKALTCLDIWSPKAQGPPEFVPVEDNSWKTGQHLL